MDGRMDWLMDWIRPLGMRRMDSSKDLIAYNTACMALSSSMAYQSGALRSLPRLLNELPCRAARAVQGLQAIWFFFWNGPRKGDNLEAFQEPCRDYWHDGWKTMEEINWRYHLGWLLAVVPRWLGDLQTGHFSIDRIHHWCAGGTEQVISSFVVWWSLNNLTQPFEMFRWVEPNQGNRLPGPT